MGCSRGTGTPAKKDPGKRTSEGHQRVRLFHSDWRFRGSWRVTGIRRRAGGVPAWQEPELVTAAVFGWKRHFLNRRGLSHDAGSVAGCQRRWKRQDRAEPGILPGIPNPTATGHPLGQIGIRAWSDAGRA